MDNLRYVSNERIKDHRKYVEQKTRRSEAYAKKADNKVTSVRAKKKHFKFFSVRSGMDMPFFFLVIILLVIGMVMMFSASYASAYYTMGDSYYFLLRQAIFAIIGVGVMIAISFFDYHHFHRLAVIVMGAAFLLLILVLFLPAINDVHRWISLGLFTLQASEVLKFAIILFYAHWASIYFEKWEPLSMVFCRLL